MIPKLADISMFEGLQAHANAQMGILQTPMTSMSVFNAGGNLPQPGTMEWLQTFYRLVKGQASGEDNLAAMRDMYEAADAYYSDKDETNETREEQLMRANVAKAITEAKSFFGNKKPMDTPRYGARSESGSHLDIEG